MKCLFSRKGRIFKYPKPPSSGGICGIVNIRSSRAWWDWWQGLGPEQRDQFLKDQIRGIYHYEA